VCKNEINQTTNIKFQKYDPVVNLNYYTTDNNIQLLPSIGYIEVGFEGEVTINNTLVNAKNYFGEYNHKAVIPVIDGSGYYVNATPDHSNAKYTISGSSTIIKDYFDTFFDSPNPGFSEYAHFIIDDDLGASGGVYEITDGKLKVCRAIVGDTLASNVVMVSKI